MYHKIKLTQPAEEALSKVQNTTLSPMEEALFQAWSHANAIEKPDAPGQGVDLRGLYQGLKGTVLPQPQLKQIVDKANAKSTLEQILSDRYKQHVSGAAQQKLSNMDSGAQATPDPDPTGQHALEASKNKWIDKHSQDAFSSAQARQSELQKELFETNRQPTELEKAMLNQRYPYDVAHNRKQEVTQQAASMNPMDFPMDKTGVK